VVTGWTEDDFEKAAQNAAQHLQVMPRIDSQPQNTAHEKKLVLPSNASSRNTMQASQVGDEGLERFSYYSIKHEVLDKSAEQVVANTVADPTLSETVALLIDGWDNMCPEERAVLTALLCVNSSDVVNAP
jgi:hypothetical protein